LVSLLHVETARRWQPSEELGSLPMSSLSIRKPTTDDELHAFFGNALGISFPRDGLRWSDEHGFGPSQSGTAGTGKSRNGHQHMQN
jgi:hypothetical protein